MSIDTQSTDQFVAQQLTDNDYTRTFKPIVADCTTSHSCGEMFDDVMVFIWNYFLDTSGHERYEKFDIKAINNSFLSSKSRLNLVGFLYE